MSLYFAAVNRNKRSLTLNIKHKAGKDILYELVKRSDVLVENFIPGKMDEMGCGYQKLRKIHKQLIYASISGYGPSGPSARKSCYDAIAAAEAGLMHITGEADGKPLRPGLGLVDMSTGLLMHGAILAALRSRDQTGEGQKVDASLFATQLSLLTNVGTNWLNMSLEGQRYGAAHPSICPYDTYKTKDGYFTLGANNERQWQILCERLGRQELFSDPKFKTNKLRVQYRDALDTMIVPVMAEKTNAEWLHMLSGSGLAHGPVNSIEQAFAHPQAEGMVVEEASKHTRSGSLRMIGPAMEFSSTPATIRHTAPSLGEHTEEILRELQYTEDDIRQFKEAGTV